MNNELKRRTIWKQIAQKHDKFERAVIEEIAGRKLSTDNIVSIEELTKEDLDLIFDVAAYFKEFVNWNDKKISLLKGMSQINFFFEDSTRTKVSFDLAGKHLGMDTIGVSKSGSSMSKKGETLNDTARTLDRMHTDVIILRHAQAGTPQMIADQIKCPVISGGDGWHEHPTQCMLDLYTILEQKGKIEGLEVVIVGDILHSRVAGSLIRGLNKFGVKPRVCGPPTMIPVGIEEVFDCKVYHNMEEAVKGVDVIYTLRVQLERAAAAFIPSIREYSKTYCVNPERLKLAKPDAIVMHPGPVNREVDIRTEVLESGQCVVEDQVENGFATRLSLLYLLLGESRR